MVQLTASQLSDLVAAFRDVRVVVLGDCMVDEYVTGDCSRLSPEAPIPVLHVRSTRMVPGGAANTAANIAALGGQAVLIGAAARDASGNHLRDLVDARGVQAVLLDDSRPTARKVRALGGQQQLLRLDYEDETPASAAVRSGLVSALKDQIRGAAAVVISDYAKGLLDAGTCADVQAAARRAGVPLIVDPRPQHGPWYTGCDYLTPNWKEAQAMTGDIGSSSADERAVGAVGRRLVETSGANVLLTLGARGIRFFPRDGGASVAERAQAREVFDVSGAGDTVVAAFALSLGAGADVPTAIAVANRAAGIVVGRIGTAVVTADDLTGNGAGERLLSRAQLRERREEWRREGRRVVLVAGAFESVGPGDLRGMQEARSRADVLLAAVIGNQGAGGAGLAVRLQIAAAMRDIDFIHVVEDVDALVAELKPDLDVRLSTADSQGTRT